MSKYVLGLDVGGTKIQAGIVNQRNKVILEKQFPMKPKNKITALNSILEAIEDIITKDVSKIGLGITGLVDTKTGIVSQSPNLPKDWHHVKLGQIIKTKYKKSAIIDNDANCIALAESIIGLGKNYNHVLSITIGTGIGAGLINNHKIYQGSQNSLEFGHTIISDTSPICSCGKIGHLEALVSGQALVKLYYKETGIKISSYEIIKKVKSASKVKLKKISNLLPKKEVIKKKFTFTSNKLVVVIGSSTGGPPALMEVLPRIPADFPAWMLIVQHMPKGFTKSLAERLNEQCAIKVKEAEEGDKYEPGTALIAPGDYHMIVKDSHIELNKNPRLHGVRPSVDPTMISASENFKNNTLGVILTGMGSDGADGMVNIKDRGGKTIAQDEKSSVIFGMPKMSIAKGCVDQIITLTKIPSAIIDGMEGLT